MFCPNCSNKIDDNSDFCSYCGTQINSNTSLITTKNNSFPTDTTSISQLRKEELQKADDMLLHFSSMQAVYSAYDMAAENIIKCQRYSKAALIWAIITSPFTILISIATLISSQVFNSTEATFAFLLANAFSGFLFTFYFRRTAKIKSRLQASVEEFCEYSSLLMKHFRAYEDCPVGPQYTNPENLRTIKNTIISGRADTVKEALNILVAHSYRNIGRNHSVKASEYVMSVCKNFTATTFLSGDAFNEFI